MPLAHIEVPVNLPSGELAIFGYHIQAATAADALTCGNTFVSALGSNAAFKARYTTLYAFGPCKVSILDSGTFKVASTSFGTAAFTGSVSAANIMPPQNAVVVTLRTAEAGSYARGRFYLPAPLPTLLTNTGRIATATVTSMLADIASAITLACVGTTVLIVLSRAKGRGIDVTQLEMDDIMDTQRRRRDKLNGARQSSPL